MPKPPEAYPHCIRCHVPLENAIMRRCETEVWYIDFATCEDCTQAMLKMTCPSITIIIDGECLKALLGAADNCFMQASVFGE